MAKKMVFTMTGDLPEDEMDAAKMIGQLKPARDAFLSAVKAAGMTVTHETKSVTIKAPSTRKSKTPATPTRTAAE